MKPDRDIAREPSEPRVGDRAVAAVLCAALADGTSELRDFPPGGEATALLEAIGELGIGIGSAGAAVTIVGCGGHLPASEAAVDLGGYRLAAVGVLAVLASGHGVYRVDHDPALDLAPAADALRDLGSQLGDDPEGPTLHLHSRGLRGGQLILGPDTASLLAGLLPPLALAGADVLVRLDLARPAPELAETLAVMEQFGVSSLYEAGRLILPAPQGYMPATISVCRCG